MPRKDKENTCQQIVNTNHKISRHLKSLRKEDKDQQICYSCHREEKIQHPSKKFSFREIILETNISNRTKAYPSGTIYMSNIPWHISRRVSRVNICLNPVIAIVTISICISRRS